MLAPLTALQAVTHFVRRKWFASGWGLGTVGFLIAFLLWFDRVSVVSELIESVQREFRSANHEAVHGGNPVPLACLILGAIQLLLEATTKVYLAQVAFVDISVEGLTHVAARGQ